MLFQLDKDKQEEKFKKKNKEKNHPNAENIYF